MAPIHISDRETDQLIRKLAERRSLSLTETIKMAVQNELLKDAEMSGVSPTDRTLLSQPGETELEAVLRSATLQYTRLVAKRRGTKGVGSRVYQMIARHGALGTLDRLVNRPTDGLEFLKSENRLELSAEKIALDDRFEKIVPNDIRVRARANLARIGCGEI